MAKAKPASKRRTARKPPKKAEVTPELVPAKVEVRISEETPDYYINYAEIASSLNEFSLYGVRMPTKLPARDLEELQKSGRVVVEPVVQLTMPITIIDGLIEALKVQKEIHETHYGKFTLKGEEK